MIVKLAFANIRKLLRDYAVYFLTLTVGAAVFYAFNTMAVQADFLKSDVAETLRQIDSMLRGLTFFLAAIMGFLMVYANNFLMRRRRRELGLYQVLGMRPSQVASIITIETLIVAVGSLAAGIGVGVLLSQLLLFVTASLFKVNVQNFHFFFSTSALGLTLACFAVTFLVMMVMNALTLRRVSLTELMSSARATEKRRLRSLPISLVTFIVGCALVGVAYWRLLSQGFPGFTDGATSTDFTITTLMVTAGTILLFYGLATALGMIVMRARKLYWRGLTMFTVRQIMNRINTACISMAIISMVLFLAITSVTTGMSISNVLNAQVEKGTPFDASISVTGNLIGYDQEKQDDEAARDTEGTQSGQDVQDNSADQSAQAAQSTLGTQLKPVDPREKIENLIAECGTDLSRLGTHITIVQRMITDPADANKLSFEALSAATGLSIPTGFQHVNPPIVLSISDYNALRMMHGFEPLTLKDNQYLYLSAMQQAEEFLNNVMQKGHAIIITDTTLTPAQTKVISDSSTIAMNSSVPAFPVQLVVPDSVAEKCDPYTAIVDINYTGDANAHETELRELYNKLKETVKTKYDGGVYIDVLTRQIVIAEGLSLTGLIAYMAIYIGFTLVVACAAILAIQQLSEAADSGERYRTLAELGCSESLIFGSLRTQISIMFIVPLLIALAHSSCALVAVLHIVEVLGIVNLASSSLMAVAIFVLVYGGYLLVTYRTAHGVVRGALQSARHDL